ncbi:9873_t:CDS:2, partial [Racocetra fulgida]
NNLTSLADAISSKLSYYNELEAITKLFNSPGENICEQPEFIPVLAKLDECLDYMQNSELYLMRFRQCMTRGITLIKMYFINTIKGLGIEISKKTNQSTNSTVQTALFYVKFRAVAPKLKELVHEVEKRCPAHRDYMYDYLRPRIIHETNIEVLSELCTILQVHLNQDPETIE